MSALLIATRNGHKVQEIRQILGEGYCYLTLTDFSGAPMVIEDADTFAGNASKKALALARWLTQNAALTLEQVTESPFYILADDSGLEVDALNGEPGVHSARFAATDASGAVNSPDEANNAKLLRLLNGVPAAQRTARFRCVLAVVRVALLPEPVAGQVESVEGSCEGRIAETASGNGGFGYDPLFIPHGYTCSFAELGEAVKNGLSHRARALEKARILLRSAA